jgi:hypothetical protein
MIGPADFVRSVARSRQAQFHIGLAAAKPNVTDEHFAQFDVLQSVNRQDVGTPGGRRLDACLPAAISAGYRPGLVPGNFDVDHVSGL